MDESKRIKELRKIFGFYYKKEPFNTYIDLWGRVILDLEFPEGELDNILRKLKGVKDKYNPFLPQLYVYRPIGRLGLDLRLNFDFCSSNQILYDFFI